MSKQLEQALALLPPKEQPKRSKRVLLRCPECGALAATVYYGKRRARPTEYMRFMSDALKRGLTFAEAVQLWRQAKAQGQGS